MQHETTQFEFQDLSVILQKKANHYDQNWDMGVFKMLLTQVLQICMFFYVNSS